MPTVNAPGVLQVTQYFSGSQGCTASNIYHVFSATPWTVDRVNSCLDVFEGWENAHGKNGRVIEVACTGFRGVDLTSLSGPLVFRVEDIVGVQTTPAAPSNVTFALKLDTGVRGRGRNGRVFWFGLSEDNVDIAEIHTDTADDLVSALSALVGLLIGADDMALCVLHKKRDGVDLDPYDETLVIGVAYTDNKLDSQRDRLPDHKRHKRKIAGGGVGGG